MEEASKLKILVVDDEKSMLNIFSELLENEGYNVIIASDGVSAVKLNEKEDPHLIILDLNMPKMDGIATLRNIRKKDKDVIVLVLTGYASADSAGDAWDLNVYEYISKPFKNDEIKLVVKEALSSREEASK